MRSMRVRQLARGRGLADRADPLGDVLGEVADPLEIAAMRIAPTTRAQILRHRLALGDQRDGAVVELALLGVHDGVVRDHALRQRLSDASSALVDDDDHRRPTRSPISRISRSI